MAVVLRLGPLIAQAFLVRMQHDVVGPNASLHIFLLGKVHRLRYVPDLADGLSGLELLTQRKNRLRARPI